MADEAGQRFAKVSKTDAARRQLQAAVLLFFNEQDPLAIHTLTAAGHEILSDLAKLGDVVMPMQQSFLAAGLSKETVDTIRAELRRPQNFLKHADRDPEAVLEFSPRVTEMMLLEAVMEYTRLTGESPPLFEAYAKWVGVHEPDWFVSNPQMHALMLAAKPRMANLSRRQYLEWFLEWAAQIKS
jgi:hypothetical protein